MDLEQIDREQFGRFVAEMRRERGLTQRELAQQLHVSDKAVSKWERGLACPDISVLPQIAEILGVNVDDLLSNPTTDKWHAFKELNRNDVKEMLLLLCRCISLVLAVGGLIIYFMGKLTASDLGIIACVAVALLSIDSLCR